MMTSELAVAERPFFGAPWEAAKSIIPPQHQFIYSPKNICTSPPPELQLQVPPTPVPMPEHGTYPHAPEFTCVKDSQYQCGYVYAANYKLTSIPAQQAHLMLVLEPHNTAPRWEQGRYLAEPIPGMVQMVPGVPYAYYIDGDADHIQTISCVHTLQSQLFRL
jgi:hypothetical protein